MSIRLDPPIQQTIALTALLAHDSVIVDHDLRDQ